MSVISRTFAALVPAGLRASPQHLSKNLPNSIFKTRPQIIHPRILRSRRQFVLAHLFLFWLNRRR